jgi:hypothetical protein
MDSEHAQQQNTNHLASGLINWGWLRMNVGFVHFDSKNSPTSWNVLTNQTINRTPKIH